MSRSSSSATPHRQANLTSTTVFQLKERVSQAAGEHVLQSRGMAMLREECETLWASLNATMHLAKALGGYVPVRYYMHEAQEGFGRMKSEVMVKGMHPVPYVRMRRDARTALAAEHYWDVDMVNCQPRLLEQKLRQYNILCPLLTRYVTAREACIDEVRSACNVTRDEAKKLFIRLVFFGGVRGWLAEHPHATADGVPPWVRGLRDELRVAAALLLKHPLLADLKDAHARRGVAMQTGADEHLQTDPLASIMALYLQTLECECVRALVRAVQGDCRAVGAIIYDGILVEKSPIDEPDGLPDELLRAWERAVQAATGNAIQLSVKPLEPSVAWKDPVTASIVSGMDSWMDGRHLLSYNEVKTRWEAQTFKVVKSGNYVREDPQDNSRSVMSDKHLMESYRHLHYSDVRVSDSGDVQVSAAHPFVTRWMKDPTIRTYKELVFAPPPIKPSVGSFNLWNGVKVEQDGGFDCDWSEHPAVQKLVEFHERLLGSPTCAYVLDWLAQMYQFPAKKTGTALLLKGEEGVGKNRFTDLQREMLGRDKFLQTATPSTTLYGRFNRQREGRLLIVINESNGGDNFAANDVIKDMITCDEFQSEGKGTNSYTMNCYARFIFTTKNDNCLRVNPDSRRYVVIEVSSAMKGNTEYFKELSALIDNPACRYAFYRFLMARDVNGIDWINSRPVTEYMLQMVAMNLPYELQFFKHEVLRVFRESRLRERVDSPVSKMALDAMYDAFVAWLLDNHARYETTRAKFGLKITKLVRNDEKNTGFVGLKKSRQGHGMMYWLDTRLLVHEMRRQRWLSDDDVA